MPSWNVLSSELMRNMGDSEFNGMHMPYLRSEIFNRGLSPTPHSQLNRDCIL